jgi:CHAT domain-containing protein/tetratricopeptide (TPR) repeat protein
MNRPDDIPRALEYVEEALEGNPALVEAWFTRALLLDRLQLRLSAMESWKKYLQLAPHSGWTAEAQERLGQLVWKSSSNNWSMLEHELIGGSISTERLALAAKDYASDVRELWIREILAHWAAQAETPDASKALAEAERVARALESSGTDGSFLRVLSEIRSADRRRKQAMARAVGSLAVGLRAQALDRPVAEAMPHLVNADNGLKDIGSELRLWAVLALARAASVQARSDDAIHLAELVAANAGDDSPVVSARAHGVLGATLFARGNWSRSQAHYEEALRLASRSGDAAVAASAHFNLGLIHRFLGNRGQTWEHRLKAAALLPFHRPIQVHLYLTIGAATASVEQLPRVALLFQDEVVANGKSVGSIGQRFEAHINRARLRSRAGMRFEAETDLIEATALYGAVENRDRQARFARALALANAEVKTSSAPAYAAEQAAHAISMIAAEQEPIRLAEARLFESRALVLAGRRDAALASALRGIDAFEHGVASIDPGELTRISAFEPVWSLFSEAARLSLDVQPHDYESAFNLTERGRARTLLALTRGTPITLRDAQRVLQVHQGLLLIDQDSHSLVAWWIGRDTVDVHRIALNASELERLVDRHRHNIDRGHSYDEASGELFERVLGPFKSRLAHIKSLSIVADAKWNMVAWPALWNRANGRALVQDVSIVLSPSVSVALKSTGETSNARNRALIVSVPIPEGARPLPGARLEARDISGIYDRSKLLEGASATVERVLENAAQAEIVHISSHAVDVPAYPLMSHLVLAGNAGTNRLFVKDIARSNLSRTRLVVLAACETVGRRMVRGEGSTGIAWGFLAAGVPQVVATLQEIDDTAARELFTRIHTYIGAGMSVAQALHTTQRELAQNGIPPRNWAITAAIGRL